VLLLMQGALVMACAVAGAFFVAFWQSTRERLFVFFAMAFGVLAIHWAVLGLLDVPSEERHFLYVPRLIAFLLFVVGIIDKNRRG
jgi:hypothetical protein